jgi:hypothetical protein
MSRVVNRRFIAYTPAFPVDSSAGNESINALCEYEQMFDLIPHGLATLDRKFRFLRVNGWADPRAS